MHITDKGGYSFTPHRLPIVFLHRYSFTPHNRLKLINSQGGRGEAKLGAQPPRRGSVMFLSSGLYNKYMYIFVKNMYNYSKKKNG